MLRINSKKSLIRVLALKNPIQSPNERLVLGGYPRLGQLPESCRPVFKPPFDFYYSPNKDERQSPSNELSMTQYFIIVFEKNGYPQ